MRAWLTASLVVTISAIACTHSHVVSRNEVAGAHWWEPDATIRIQDGREVKGRQLELADGLVSWIDPRNQHSGSAPLSEVEAITTTSHFGGMLDGAVLGALVVGTAGFLVGVINEPKREFRGVNRVVLGAVLGAIGALGGAFWGSIFGAAVGRRHEYQLTEPSG
ncbi:hypothetical protein ACFL6C_05610 [Myxococcota bacterium]